MRAAIVAAAATFDGAQDTCSQIEPCLAIWTRIWGQSRAKASFHPKLDPIGVFGSKGGEIKRNSKKSRNTCHPSGPGQAAGQNLPPPKPTNDDDDDARAALGMIMRQSTHRCWKNQIATSVSSVLLGGRGWMDGVCASNPAKKRNSKKINKKCGP